jgi:hypothetical protein
MNAIEIELNHFLEFLIYNHRLLQAGITVSDTNYVVIDFSKGLLEQIESNLNAESKNTFLAYAERWNKFSGDPSYPVADPSEKETPQEIYLRFTQAEKSMFGKDSYSSLNWQLVCFVRDEFQKKLRLNKNKRAIV